LIYKQYITIIALSAIECVVTGAAVKPVTAAASIDYVVTRVAINMVNAYSSG
jgi:hypothetical protein